MTKSFAVGYVIYHPTARLHTRLAMLSELGYQTLVFDNSPADGTTRTMAKDETRISYFTVGNNVGLGVGISAVCAQAYYSGQTKLLFFDQDTDFDSETLDFVDRFLATHPELETTHSAITFSADSHGTPNTAQFRDVMLTINSGSLFYLRNCERLGWHNPHFFVDCVDYEFCLRSLLLGLRTGKIPTQGIDHRTEQGDVVLNLLGRRVPARRYSRRRILDKITGSFKLLRASAMTGQFRFGYEVGRALMIYIFIQMVAHMKRIGSQE